MNSTEISISLTLAAVLVGLALYFGWRQWQTLRTLKSPEEANVDDRRYLRARSYRRLLCSLLMLLLAGFLVGGLWLGSGLHDAQVPVTEEQKAEREEFLRLFSTYWIVFLLIVLILVSLAALDFWATARYGLNQHRRLQADRRAFLQQQISQRRDRNGSS